MSSRPLDIPNRSTGSNISRASMDSSSPLSIPVRPSPRRSATAISMSRERLSSVLAYEPRIIRADTHANMNRDPGCAPDAPSTSSSSNYPISSPTRNRRPSVATVASSARSPVSIGPRRTSITQLPSSSSALHHNPRQTSPIRTRTTSSFSPPPYLRHSTLYHKMSTESDPDSTQELKLTMRTARRRRMLSPALSDTDDDDDEHSVSSPPLRSTANTTPSTYTAPKDGILRLPTRWNEHARHPSLTVSSDGRDLTYSGTSLTDVEAVSARANHPIPPACGVFYYEIEILRSKGGAGAGAKAQISLGFSDSATRVRTLPGWDQNSWGYHGDDGLVYSSDSTKGTKFGPTLGGSDIVGCGINYTTNKAFFTRNGDLLGHAFNSLPTSGPTSLPLYPFVGLQRPGDCIRANFGHEKFAFDIDAYAQEAKEAAWSTRQSTEIDLATLGQHFNKEAAHYKRQEQTLMDNLILEYLEHHGYVDTAKVFREQSTANLAGSAIKPESDAPMDIDNYNDVSATHIHRRTEIVNYVRAGEIDAALEGLERWFPGVLRGPAIKAEEEGSMYEDAETLSPENFLWLKLRCRKFIELVLHAAEVGRRAAAGEGQMDVDEYSSYSAISRKKPHTSQQDAILQQAVTYGQNLQSDYRQASDADPRVRDMFRRTFGILAWADPIGAGGLSAQVAGKEARYALAEEVRKSILSSQGHPTQPTLETAFRRTSVCLNELAMLGSGAAAYMDMQKEFRSDAADAVF